jgi:HlyD family secretion protein
VAVEVGINNEDNIEIISGLKEGDAVVLPTVARSSSTNPQAGFPGLGGGVIPGGGGFQGGGGGGGRPATSGGGAAGGAAR